VLLTEGPGMTGRVRKAGYFFSRGRRLPTAVLCAVARVPSSHDRVFTRNARGQVLTGYRPTEPHRSSNDESTTKSAATVSRLASRSKAAPTRR
jgi:hypothetical protein